MATLRGIPADAPELAAALQAAQLPVADLAEDGRIFFALEDAGRTVGYGGYEIYGEDALLRSVVVLPAERGRGHGRALTDALRQAAAASGARRFYLLTTTAAGFFAAAGFRRIERTEAPPAILATRQAATICSTATLLACDVA